MQQHQQHSEQNSCSPTTAHNDDSYKRIFHVYKYSASTSALFERNFSTHPILVRLEFHNASAFDVWLHNRRPLNRIRQHTAEEHFDFEHGLLYRDACSLKINLESTKLLHTAGDVIAVEIKPKQGWNICSLSGSLLNLLGIDEPRRLKCRFCAMQFLKVWPGFFSWDMKEKESERKREQRRAQNYFYWVFVLMKPFFFNLDHFRSFQMQGNAVKRMSKYCPMDLFSGFVRLTFFNAIQHKHYFFI